MHRARVAAIEYMEAAVAEELYDDAIDAELDEEVARRWRLGELAEMKLDEHQLEVYWLYRKWEEEITAARMVASVAEREKKRGVRGLVRVFVMDIARRWGKTFLVALILIEDLIRNKRWIKTYGTAAFKDLADIVIPMIDELCEDAPSDVKPLFHSSFRGIDNVYVFPSTGSQLKLVGLDKQRMGQRGRASHGMAITEASRVPKLAPLIGSKIYPLFQRRKKATLILESNAPDDPEHDFDRIFVPDAEKRGAYVFRDIDDNKAISEEEKQEFLDASDAIDPEITQLEYYGKRIRSPKRMVCAEFDLKRHVVPMPVFPKYAYAFTFMDPGEEDPLGLVWAYWDFERCKLVCVRSYCESNMRTPACAEMIKEVEQDFWSTPRIHGPEDINKAPKYHNFHHSKGWKFVAPPHALTYWDGKMFKPNPAARVSDIDAHMLGDLAVLHDIGFDKAEKYNAESAQGQLRTAFAQDMIEIVEDSGPLAQQCQRGVWQLDKEGRRVGWARSPALGHLDAYACLVYGWRKVQHYRYLNPNPPAVTDRKASGVAAMPWHEDAEPKSNRATAKLSSMLKPRRRR